jgi:hypothetical protein
MRTHRTATGTGARLRTRFLAHLLAIGIAVAALAGASTASAESHRIVVGHSIGPIKLGMARARVHQVYHHKHSSRFLSGPRTFIEKYQHGKVTVTYCCGQRLSAKAFSIVTTSARWITKEGIGVGDSELKLVATYSGVQCYDDVPGPTGVLVACQLQDGSRITTFHMDPIENVIEGIQVYVNPTS